jgi:hypothetical protein
MIAGSDRTASKDEIVSATAASAAASQIGALPAWRRAFGHKPAFVLARSGQAQAAAAAVRPGVR